VSLLPATQLVRCWCGLPLSPWAATMFAFALAIGGALILVITISAWRRERRWKRDEDRRTRGE
jgi:hypothetical protein